MNKLNLLLVFLVATIILTGCLPDDPTKAAEAQERTTNAAIAANQSNAQIQQAQQSDDEARRNAERLEALQAQQAIIQGQQAIAEANARQGIAESDNVALVKVADQIAEASKPDNTILIVVLVCSFGLAGVVIWKLFSANVQLVQAATATQPSRSDRQALPARQLLPEPSYIQIPAGVQAHAKRLGGVAEWTGDKWVIVDPNSGRRIATQRKQITMKEG